MYLWTPLFIIAYKMGWVDWSLYVAVVVVVVFTV